ncbi:MAG TPA: hypothetical protein VKD91_10935 [Pyrinomonadaceae bacterium]|nr:hypothetical protein [Pyrinomonadaceae bacterium]
MSQTISPNSTIAQYSIISKMGAGGMGEVYRIVLNWFAEVKRVVPGP